jgi:hypothetical protein
MTQAVSRTGTKLPQQRQDVYDHLEKQYHNVQTKKSSLATKAAANSFFVYGQKFLKKM